MEFTNTCPNTRDCYGEGNICYFHDAANCPFTYEDGSTCTDMTFPKLGVTYCPAHEDETLYLD